jgi:PhoPQ-activated pathogenicity-related protein
LNTEAGEALRAIVDPYSYRQRLTQPKLIILGTNDPYWPLDALNLYWDGLSGEKHVLYIPNNVHGLTDYPRILGSLNALHQHVRTGKPLPKLDWKFANGGKALSLSVTSDVPPIEVKAWVARSKTRDFRQAMWESFPTRGEKGLHSYDLEVPAEGFAALFAEASYPAEGFPYSFTTNLQIVKGSGN